MTMRSSSIILSDLECLRKLKLSRTIVVETIIVCVKVRGNWEMCIKWLCANGDSCCWRSKAWHSLMPWSGAYYSLTKPSVDPQWCASTWCRCCANWGAFSPKLSPLTTWVEKFGAVNWCISNTLYPLRNSFARQIITLPQETEVIRPHVDNLYGRPNSYQ